MVAMIKENGEAGHVSVRVIGDQFYFIAGSKNVHLVFRTAQDLELYTDSRYRNFKRHTIYVFHYSLSRFKIAKVVGEAWLRQLVSVAPSLSPTLLTFLSESRLTMIFEVVTVMIQFYIILPHDI